MAGLVGSVLFVALPRENVQQALGSSAASQIDTLEAQLKNGSTPAEVVVPGQQDVVIQIVGDEGRLVASDHPNLSSPLLREPGLGKGIRAPGLRDSYVVLARRTSGGDLLVVGRSE